MSKDALGKQAQRSSPTLAGSQASFASISDLGDEYLQAGGPRTPSLASMDDQLDGRDRPTHLSGPPSPSQLTQASMGDGGPGGLDASRSSTSRQPSTVTFGPTTATYFPQQSQGGSEELSPDPDARRGRKATDQTGLLLDAQQPHRGVYSSLSTSRSAREESPSPSPYASLRSPGTQRLRKKLAKTASFVGLRRAQSYDEGLGAGTTDVNVVSNGTRHWTASFSSVDWVHDGVKGQPRSFCSSHLTADAQLCACRCLPLGQHPQSRAPQLALEGLPALGPPSGLGRRHRRRNVHRSHCLCHCPRCVCRPIRFRLVLLLTPRNAHRRRMVV